MTVNFKFDVGDRVWVIWKSKAFEDKVDTVWYHKSDFSKRNGEIIYRLKHTTDDFKEDQVFATKEELIASL